MSAKTIFAHGKTVPPTWKKTPDPLVVNIYSEEDP
jgi:hypothetical protein